jgi:hypothetical protein
MPREQILRLQSLALDLHETAKTTRAMAKQRHGRIHTAPLGWTPGVTFSLLVARSDKLLVAGIVVSPKLEHSG